MNISCPFDEENRPSILRFLIQVTFEKYLTSKISLQENLVARYRCVLLNLGSNVGYLAGKFERGPHRVSSSRLKGEGVSFAESQRQSSWIFLDKSIARMHSTCPT